MPALEPIRTVGPALIFLSGRPKTNSFNALERGTAEAAVVTAVNVLKSEVEACEIFRQTTRFIAAFLFESRDRKQGSAGRTCRYGLTAGAAKNSCSSTSSTTAVPERGESMALASHFPFIREANKSPISVFEGSRS